MCVNCVLITMNILIVVRLFSDMVDHPITQLISIRCGSSKREFQARGFRPSYSQSLER
jgi:hypothetical protein